MGVMTSKDMGMTRKTPESKGGAAKAASSAQAGKHVKAVRFDRAPQGKSNAAFMVDGETVNVKLKDGVYVFKDWPEEKRLRPAMIKAGFKPADHWEGDLPKNPPKDRSPKSLRLAHPDNGPDEPKQGNIAVRVGDQEFKFELDEHGTIWVDDADAQKHLKKQGWEEIDSRPVPKKKRS